MNVLVITLFPIVSLLFLIFMVYGKEIARGLPF